MSPGSSELFDPEIQEFLQTHPGPILDIGPGCGKMGLIAKAAGCSPVTCIEIYKPYIRQFQLDKIYDEIEIGDACELVHQGDRLFGTVIIGDCIEHFPKSRGRDLLEYLVIRSLWVLIKYPVNLPDCALFQGTSYGNPKEAHVSVWADHDFSGLDVEISRNWAMRLAIVKGYRQP